MPPEIEGGDVDGWPRSEFYHVTQCRGSDRVVAAGPALLSLFDIRSAPPVVSSQPSTSVIRAMSAFEVRLLRFANPFSWVCAREFPSVASNKSRISFIENPARSATPNTQNRWPLDVWS
jgi:hypothetical protein